MADSSKRKREDSVEPGLEARIAAPASPLELEPSNSTSNSTADNESSEAADFTHILATFPPVQEWSRETIDSLKSAVKDKYPDARWKGGSKWTQRLINIILAPNKGWDWQRLNTCLNADYFSLSTHIITLLNAVFYSNVLGKVQNHGSHLKLGPAFDGKIGYPIFRVDYTSNKRFELYKKCWDQFMEIQFYLPGTMDRAAINWCWVNDKAELDGKGCHEVQQLYSHLSGTTLPEGLKHLWVCLMADRAAIESLL